MKIIIVGAGRLGSNLALELLNDGEDVTVISDSQEKISKFDRDFSGKIIFGKEFDKDILEEAGIETADSLISCTESDETNALVARIARIHYKVPKVIARLYDKRKVAIYNALGIQVIATTEWGISRTKELLTFNKIDTIMSIGNTPVDIVKVAAPALLNGKTLRDAFPIDELKVFAISRNNESFVPSNHTVIEQGDIIYFSVLSKSLGEVSRILDIH